MSAAERKQDEELDKTQDGSLTGPVITAGLQDSADSAPASPAVLIFLELQPRAPWSVHPDVKALILRRKHLLLRVMYMYICVILQVCISHLSGQRSEANQYITSCIRSLQHFFTEPPPHHRQCVCSPLT